MLGARQKLSWPESRCLNLGKVRSVSTPSCLRIQFYLHACQLKRVKIFHNFWAQAVHIETPLFKIYFHESRGSSLEIVQTRYSECTEPQHTGLALTVLSLAKSFTSDQQILIFLLFSAINPISTLHQASSGEGWRELHWEQLWEQLQVIFGL